MVIEKMTKEILMKFLPGDQKVFTLPSFEKAQSAAVQAHRDIRVEIQCPHR